LVLSLGLALFLAVVLIGREVSLIGLPDIGDPFDVNEVYAAKVSDEQNAFVFFRQATAKFRPRPVLPRAEGLAGPAVGWSKADPKMREWVEANREALDLFRQAAEQSDGVAHPAGDETAFHSQRVLLRPFVWLALLEGSRLEERGDMAGAWAWYRAVVRMRAHVTRRGTIFERFFADIRKDLQQRVSLWAADPRTGAPQLRRALDDVTECEPKPEWDAFSLKVEYLLLMRELDQPVVTHADDEDLVYRLGGEPLPPNLAQSVFAARQFLQHEPERSRRVLRLVFAIWLAHVETPEERHRKPAVRATFLSNKHRSGVPFYAAGPTAPAGARALPPQDLARWLLTAHDAKLLLMQWPWPSISLRERQEHRALLVLLAGELYRRERGGPPPSDEALVGTYLKTLPDDGTADLDDGTALTVEDPQASAPKADRK
jgi:hypothetical protein